MNKNIYRLIACIIISTALISLIGCETNTSSVNTNKTINANSNTSNNSNIENQSAEIKTLNENDFIISYENTKVTVGQIPDELFQIIGEGTANTDNNWGFVGYDDLNEYKYYSHGYPSDSPHFFIRTKTKIDSGNVIISDIDISTLGTNRNIKVDSSIEDILELYGTPDKIIDYDDNVTNYEYFLGNKVLDFYLNSNNNKISQIILRYIDKK